MQRNTDHLDDEMEIHWRTRMEIMAALETLMKFMRVKRVQVYVVREVIRKYVEFKIVDQTIQYKDSPVGGSAKTTNKRICSVSARLRRLENLRNIRPGCRR